MSKTVNIGVIGMGKMGLLHASLVNVIPDTKLVAIYDKSPIIKKLLGKAISNVRIANKFEDFASGKYDAVYVTTPIPSHFSIINDIYASGITKNLFVEKTLTSHYNQSDTLCRKAKAEGGVTMVGYMSRFGPTFKKAKSLLEDKTIGDLIAFKAYAYASDFANTKEKSSAAKGGATRDLGSHVIDLSIWFFKDLEVDPVPLNPTVAENAETGSGFKVHGPQGLTGEFDISWSKEGYRLPQFGLIINGSKGTISVNADAVRIENGHGDVTSWYRQNLDNNVPFLLGAPEYYRESEHFIKAILNGTSAESDFSSAAKVDRLIEQAETAGGI